MSARTIPDAVRNAQLAAADPAASVFVSANAGSGKTHVLAQRVINLLLDGVDPAKILCITFTKAAAATMANRVFDTLSKWTALDDAALDIEIAKASGKPVDARRRATARRLFAAALETPGGLKVQTIHAFCTRLLHQFPFEADVAAKFGVLDDATTRQLLDQITLDVLLEASANPDGPLGHALAGAITAAADVTFKAVVTAAIGKRDILTAWIASAGSVDAAIAQLSHELGVEPSDSKESIENEFFSHSLVPMKVWPELIERLSAGSTNDRKHIEALNEAHAATGRARITAYLKVFCTTKLEPRENILTKKLADANADWVARLQAEQDRVCALLQRERAIAARDRTRALVTIAAAVIARYRREKDRRGLLDYDDLIDKTRALFGKTSAAWVLYKLDLGVDHMLVDEAQDTSPEQWDIIKTIVAEFVPGGSRGGVRRTVFAVGDEKQSIFSFQGAAPLAFDENRKHFERAYRDSGFDFRREQFEYSFRSGANILGAVDQVFSRAEAFAGLTADPAPTVHSALPDAAPGEVEIWPLIAPADKREMEGWDAPFDTQSEDSPQVKLARRIAASVKVWRGRGVRPKDVLILVRQRGALFEGIIRALKAAGVEVAGADRLVLTSHIAVMDLIVLADALLLPDDDLALATVLKSPLFGLDDDDLFALAWQRKGSLRASLRGNAKFSDANAKLDQLAEASRKLPPFAFYAHVLGAAGGRKQFLTRLGAEANDALDEFLNLALDYEAKQTPSLQGFVAWLRQSQSEVKRDMEMARDEVRVMTVHGAKGLEAKIVILADTTTRPTGPRDPPLLTLAGGSVVWANARGNDAGAMTDARNKVRREAEDEYRRLLYVAMTRAAERLIVCGTQSRGKIPDGCWYALVNDALAPDSVSEPADDGDGEVLRYRKVPVNAAPAISASVGEAPRPMPPAPWLRRNAPGPAKTSRIITPSSTDDDDIVRAGNNNDARAARRRGVLMHRLMQSLPDGPQERRIDAGRAYLRRNASNFSEAECEAMLEQVRRVLEDERFAALFAPGSRAEVPVAGRLTLNGEVVLVSGQIDRLAITKDGVLIADSKTNRNAPQRIEDVPQRYLRQLALYRAVLRPMFPNLPIRAALIWTEGPEIMELSSQALDNALMQVTSA